MPHDVSKKKSQENGWRLARAQPSKAFQNRLLWRCGGGVGVKYSFAFIVSSWRCQVLFPFPGNLVGTESSGSNETQWVDAAQTWV